MLESELKRDIRRTANGHGAAILSFYAILYTAVFAVSLLLHGTLTPQQAEWFNLGTYVFQYFVAVPLAILIFRLVSGRKELFLRECFRRPAVSTGTMLKWILMGLSVIYASAYIANFISLLLRSIGIELSQPDMSAGNSMLSWFTNLFAMIVMAPIFEELLFRGTIFRSTRSFGIWPVFVCGILFGLWHINYAQLIYAAVMGIAACMIVCKTGSILPTILMHIILNTIGAVQTLFIGDFDPERIMAMDMGYIRENLLSLTVIYSCSFLNMLLALAGGILLIIELCSHKETFRLPKPSLPMKPGRMLAVYLTSPLMVLCLLVLLVLTVLRAMGIL